MISRNNEKRPRDEKDEISGRVLSSAPGKRAVLWAKSGPGAAASEGQRSGPGWKTAPLPIAGTRRGRSRPAAPLLSPGEAFLLGSSIPIASKHQSGLNLLFWETAGNMTMGGNKD